MELESGHEVPAGFCYLCDVGWSPGASVFLWANEQTDGGFTVHWLSRAQKGTTQYSHSQ